MVIERKEDELWVLLTLKVNKATAQAISKIEQAKNAAIKAVEKLNNGDFISIVCFDDKVEVLVEATKINTKNKKDIISKNLEDKIPSVSDRIGLKNAYNHYGSFVILHFTKERKETNNNTSLYTGISIYDPSKADFIYQNEIYVNLMWDGWTDQGTMYPLYNSLIDYLNKQK